MKAVILVGGEATRLRPLTCNISKAMVPVLNKPFLEHVIGHLSEHQVKDIILALGQLSSPIENCFGDGSQFGVRLYYVVEDEPLGTGGAVKHAKRYLDENFLVLNGDIFTDLDITAMLGFHQQKNAKFTIAATWVEDPSSYGVIETDSNGKITRFVEKPDRDKATTNMINAGTYILEPDVLAHIPSQVKFSIEHELFAKLPIPEIPAYRFDYYTYWMDMGTPEKYLQLHRDLLIGRSSRFALAPGEEIVIGEQSYVHPTAQIKGPVMIAGSCKIGPGVRIIGPAVIGSGCEILADAVIEESVIWQDTRIGEQVILRESIVADHCCLNAGSVIEGSVLGDNVDVVGGCELESGSKIWAGETVGAP